MEIPNFMKINSVGAEFFQTDGRTNMKKMIVAFYNFGCVSKLFIIL